MHDASYLSGAISATIRQTGASMSMAHIFQVALRWWFGGIDLEKFLDMTTCTSRLALFGGKTFWTLQHSTSHHCITTALEGNNRQSLRTQLQSLMMGGSP